MLEQNYQYKLELEYQLRQADKLVDKIKKLELQKAHLKKEVAKFANAERQTGKELYTNQRILEQGNLEKAQVGSPEASRARPAQGELPPHGGRHSAKHGRHGGLPRPRQGNHRHAQHNRQNRHRAQNAGGHFRGGNGVLPGVQPDSAKEPQLAAHRAGDSADAAGQLQAEGRL